MCKLISKAGDKAEIEIVGQKVFIPVKYLPTNNSINDEYQLFLLSNNHLDKTLAKNILEEILNGK